MPMPMAEACARPVLMGVRRATSLPAGRTRRSVLCWSLNILPTATAMLKPDVPVSYAVKVSVGGSLRSWAMAAGEIASAARAAAKDMALMYRCMSSDPPMAMLHFASGSEQLARSETDHATVRILPQSRERLDRAGTRRRVHRPGAGVLGDPGADSHQRAVRGVFTRSRRRW